MANPEWAINLLERSETVVDFLKRNASSTNISNLSGLLKKGLSESNTPLPPGQMYHSLEHCVVSNFVEGCVAGGGLGVLVSVLPSLLKGKFRKAVSSLATPGIARVGLFFGSLLTISNTGMYMERRASSPKSLRLLIGFLSGLSVVVLPRSIRRFIVYFLLTRSIEVAARLIRAEIVIARRRAQRAIRFQAIETLCATGSVDDIVSVAELSSAPIREEDMFTSHEVVSLASGSMAVIITAWFRYTHLVPKGYLMFLQGINNLSPVQVENIQKVLTANCADRPDLRLVVDRSARLCSVLHPPDQSCSDFSTAFLLKGLLTKSAPFYAKLYSLPLIFSILKNRGSNLSPTLVKHFAVRVWWSALFLATMNASVAATVCGIHNAGIASLAPLTLHASLGGAVSAASLYLEQDSRRLELALYLFGQAIQISVNAYTHAGLWAPRGVDTLVCASSIALILFAFWEQHDLMHDPELADEERLPTIIRSGYATLMGRITDSPYKRHKFALTNTY